nr:PrsW family intramembrane metalloprotease [Natronobacterium texcoconense]
MRSLLDSLARTGRVARWEISRSTGTVDRKTVFVVVAMLIAVGVVGLSVADEGLGLEDEIYVVGVDETDPYHDVAVASDRFRTVPAPEGGLEGVYYVDDPGVDLVIERGEIGHVGENGPAAYDAFRNAVERYNEGLMAQENDEAAAYPVRVSIDYEDRSYEGAIAPPGEGTDGPTRDDETETDRVTSVDGETSPDDETAAPDDGTSGDGESAGDDETESDDGIDLRSDADGTDEQTTTEIPEFDDLDDEAGYGSPSTLSPPFPFQSLILAFLFIVPMNFVIQAYGSTIMDERIKRRGELLLVSPASSREIVAGKTLPYLIGLVGIVVAITVAIRGGVLSVAATVPIALLFLAATFAGAMFARSFKELTFVTVTISVVLTTYAFIPAIFTDVTPIALISPLTLVVMDLQGESPTLAAYLVSTGPAYLTAGVFFLLGLGTYREEDMFAQKPVPTKAIDAIATRVKGKRSIPALTVVFVPFVFAAQLLAIALLFAAPATIAIPIIVLFAAAVEELAKSIHVYAGFSRSRLESTVGMAVVLGVLSGAAFFLAEKVTQIVQLVGLHEFDSAIAAFGPEIAGADAAGGPLVYAGILLAPLVLHAVTATVSAVGATRGRTSYVIAVTAATVVHAGYNIGVILLVA